MSKVAIDCDHCGKTAMKWTGSVNRSRAMGAPLYCSVACAGMGRRDTRTKEERVAAKAAYDAKRRVDLADEIRAAHAEYHRRTYDPDKARARRDLGALRAYHKQHNLKPEVKAAKRAYDREYTGLPYGEYAECRRLLTELEREIRKLEPSWYERAKARGYYDRPRARDRKREANAE